jgi:hypothetical protein
MGEQGEGGIYSCLYVSWGCEMAGLLWVMCVRGDRGACVYLPV